MKMSFHLGGKIYVVQCNPNVSSIIKMNTHSAGLSTDGCPLNLKGKMWETIKGKCMRILLLKYVN